MARLAILDRDGTINVDRPDSVKSVAELALIPGAAAAIRRLNDAGIKVAVATNQGVVGRRIIDEARLASIHGALRDALRSEAGAHLDEIFVCTDPPDRPGPRRKPAPGMLLEALRRFGASASETAMIGDDARDLEAAKAAGCRRVLVRTGKGAAVQAKGIAPALLPVAVHADLSAAVDALLRGDA